jgi:hypothetical protein
MWSQVVGSSRVVEPRIEIAQEERPLEHIHDVMGRAALAFAGNNEGRMAEPYVVAIQRRTRPCNTP